MTMVMVMMIMKLKTMIFENHHLVYIYTRSIYTRGMVSCRYDLAQLVVAKRPEFPARCTAVVLPVSVEQETRSLEQALGE